jgi:hypothetical protein
MIIFAHPRFAGKVFGMHLMTLPRPQLINMVHLHVSLARLRRPSHFPNPFPLVRQDYLMSPNQMHDENFFVCIIYLSLHHLENVFRSRRHS